MKRIVLGAALVLLISFAHAAQKGQPRTEHNILSSQLPAALLADIKRDYKDYWITALSEEGKTRHPDYSITLENADLIGLELARDIYGIVVPELSCAKPPSRLLSESIDEGKLGMKSGEGLRVWTSEESAAVRRRLSEHLLKMLVD